MHSPTHVVNGKGPQRATRTVYVDSSFRDEELKIVTESADEWNDRTKGIAHVDVVRLPLPPKVSPKFSNTTDDVFLEKQESTSSEVFFLDHTTQSILFGLYRVESGFSKIILITDRFTSSEEYRTVVTHELGHSLGLSHNNVKRTVMYKDHGQVGNHIAREDLEQFCEIYSCDVEELMQSKK